MIARLLILLILTGCTTKVKDGHHVCKFECEKCEKVKFECDLSVENEKMEITGV
jgi:hypothetical protein